MGSCGKWKNLLIQKESYVYQKEVSDPSVSSNERKKKHGLTSPHGVTGRGKTHIGGNPLGTCTQGSTSPSGNRHRASHDRPTDQSPNGQKDTSGRPGIYGHQEPAIGHSPTTGQMGEEETSSLPITEHRPSVIGIR